jgi:hypothetical protein
MDVIADPAIMERLRLAIAFAKEKVLKPKVQFLFLLCEYFFQSSELLVQTTHCCSSTVCHHYHVNDFKTLVEK